MEFLANAGSGMIIISLCIVVFVVLYSFQKHHPVLNKVLGYCGICLGLAVVMIWGKADGQLSDDPGFKAGLIISIIGAALLALGDIANSD